MCISRPQQYEPSPSHHLPIEPISIIQFLHPVSLPISPYDIHHKADGEASGCSQLHVAAAEPEEHDRYCSHHEHPTHSPQEHHRTTRSFVSYPTTHFHSSFSLAPTDQQYDRPRNREINPLNEVLSQLFE